MNYMLEDIQGGVAAFASSAGALDIDEVFSVFGQRRSPTNWSNPASSADLTTIAGLSRQGFTFQTALGQSMGLNHMNGRVQDAILGRMLSPDPHIPDPTNAQSYNRYSYVNNNPLTFIDPSGFGPCGYNTFCDNGNNTVTFYPAVNQVAVFTNGVSGDYSLFSPQTMQSNLISVPPTPGLQNAYTQYTINYNNRGPTQSAGNSAGTPGGTQNGDNAAGIQGDTPPTITTQQAADQQAETNAIAAQIAAQTQAAVDQANAAAAAAAAQIINSLPTPAPAPIQGTPSSNGNASPDNGNASSNTGNNGPASGGDSGGSDQGGGGNAKSQPEED